MSAFAVLRFTTISNSVGCSTGRSFGLAPLIVRDLFKILGKINREDKVTILVVEQNAQLALELADQAYVIETGRIVMSGDAKDIATNEDVRKSYLGY